MAQSSYEVRIADVNGNVLLALGARSFTRLDLAYRETQVGTLVLDLPGVYDYRLFQKDGRIQVLRALPGAAPYLEGERSWLIRKIMRTVSAGGKRGVRLVAEDGMTLLRRRIVDYDAGSANTDKTAAADDLIKDIADENFVSATDATRNWGSTLFRVATSVGAAPSISKAFARREVLAICQEIAEASTLAGTYLSFDVIDVGGVFELRTYTGQRGVDHSAGSDVVKIGPAFRNLTNVERTDDSTEEATRIIAGGQGEEADRTVARSDDTTRQGESPFGLIEAFTNQNNTDDATQLADEADAALRAARPRRTLTGTFVDTPGVTYGRHFGFGDLVSAQLDDESFVCRVDAVHLTVEGGKETIDIRLQSEGL